MVIGTSYKFIQIKFLYVRGHLELMGIKPKDHIKSNRDLIKKKEGELK